jgi:hypothetical protein
MDAAIAAAATDNGGVYDPAAHLAAMAARPPTIAGRKLEPADVVAANLRRLARLGRHHLVSPVEGGRWLVPPDLLGQLAAREADQPRFRVSVDRIESSLQAQVERRAPTWLDKIDAGGTAPYSFGAEVQRALQERAKFVAGLDLAPGVTTRSRMAELERRELGERVAAENGCLFVAAPPAGFQGVVLGVHPGGRLAILDQRSRQVAIVDVEGSPTPFKNRVVEIVRGPGGKVTVRQQTLERE